MSSSRQNSARIPRALVTGAEVVLDAVQAAVAGWRVREMANHPVALGVTRVVDLPVADKSGVMIVMTGTTNIQALHSQTP